MSALPVPSADFTPPWTLFQQVSGIDVPVFRRDEAAYSIFYTPGAIAVVDAPGAEAFREGISPESPPDSEGRVMWDLARDAEAARQRQMSAPYQPVCLTLYLHHTCNLACPYCYAGATPRPTVRISEEAVLAAARLVAVNCQQQDLPLTMVFHGGGEPTLDQRQVTRLLRIVRRVAADHGIPSFCYIATNGIFPAEKARWVAVQFDLVGLSCDGPAPIQNRQRPTTGGGATAQTVERTARLLHAANTPFEIRVTVTRRTLADMPEIAAYLCETLRPQAISMEPVYATAGDLAIYTAAQAEAFVAGFMTAQVIATSYGIPLHQSLSRYHDQHGPHCHVARDVLHLMPDGSIPLCFKASSRMGTAFQLGTSDTAEGAITLDADQAQRFKHRLGHLPAPCAGCFNRYHCVRGCPDSCALTAEGADGHPGPRCHIAGGLTFAWMQHNIHEWHVEPAHGRTRTLIRTQSTRSHGYRGRKWRALAYDGSA